MTYLLTYLFVEPRQTAVNFRDCAGIDHAIYGLCHTTVHFKGAGDGER